jgi:hypothetical protein
MIPEFDDGCLPDGVHDCSFEEVAARFGRFQTTDRRVRLTDRLAAYLDDAGRSGIVVAVLIDGRYVMSRDDPDDIDLIVVRRADVDVTGLRPFEYNAISKRVIRSAYKFDVFSVADGSLELAERTAFFCQVARDKHADLTARTTNGPLRIRL